MRARGKERTEENASKERQGGRQDNSSGVEIFEEVPVKRQLDSVIGLETNVGEAHRET